MSDSNKKPEDSKEKMDQHKKSTDTSKAKEHASKKSNKDVHKTGTKDDDWNDPTGNSHLGDKS